MRFQFCLANITTAFIMHSRKDYFTLVSLSLEGEISSPVYSAAQFFKHHLFTFATYSTSFPLACFIIYFERFLCLHETTKNWSKVNIWAVLRRVLRCFSLFIHGSDIKHWFYEFLVHHMKSDPTLSFGMTERRLFNVACQRQNKWPLHSDEINFS